MKERRHLLEHISTAADLQGEAVPGLPLIEILGSSRVLIEQHCGVTEYGCQEIHIKVKGGEITVCGRELELALMTKEQLIICGCIDAVSLKRRGR